MLGNRWTRKPPAGTPLDAAHPLCAGLVGCWPLNEGAGATAANIAPAAGGENAGTLSGGPAWAVGPWGPGVSVPGAGRIDCGHVAALDGATKASIFVLGSRADSSGGFAAVQGSQSAADTFGIDISGSAGFACAAGHYGLPWGAAASGRMAVGFAYDGTQYANNTAYHFINGAYANDSSGNYGSGAIAAGTDAFTIGWIPDSGSSTATFYLVLLWAGRVLQQADFASLQLDPWQVFRPASAWSPAGIGALSTATVKAASPVYANGAAQALPLLGYLTNWSGGTPFGVSGVPGVSLSGPATVADATHASLPLAVGTTTGSLVVTDGTLTASVPVLTPSIAIAPGTIPADHAGQIVLTLTGSGTTWTAGTGFAISGVSGVVKVGQSVASATSATVTVTTGAGSGTLTISDGTYSVAVSVGVPTLSVAASPDPVATGSSALSIRAANTIWSLESPGFLSLSDTRGAGAALSDVRLITDGWATATLSTGPSTAAGTVTITDTTTGRSATVPVLPAAPATSLHLGGQCLLAHTGGGAVGAFGGRAAAGIGWRFRADSNVGIGPMAGTTVLTWGANYSGATPLAAYFPGTGQLVLTAYPAAGDPFTATIPVQPGVDYHFLLSWAAGSQALYVNGVLHATGTVAGNTYPASGLRVGADAGPGVAADLCIEDVMLWGGYAPTAADAEAMAARSSTPLQLGTPPAAWWPLGGGTSGATASLSDPYLADVTGGGNTLSLAAGSLSAATYSAPIGLSSPVAVTAYAMKCGRLLFFGAASSATLPGASRPAVAPLSAVGGTPTVYRGGTAVSIGPAVDFPGDAPFVAYLAEFGAADRLAIVDGGAGLTNPAVSWVPGSGGGTSLTLGTPVLQTGVVGYTIANPGTGCTYCTVAVGTPSGYDSGPDSPQQAAATATVAGGQVTSVVPAAGGLLGCGSGYVKGSPPALTISTDGTGVSIAPIVDTYVSYVPVASSSGDFTGLPSFTVSDSPAPSRSPSFRAIMTGAAPGDVLTYDAPAGWITPTLGGLPAGGVRAVAGAAMANYAGRKEGAAGAFGAFSQAPTLVAGGNSGEQPTGYASASFPGRNRMQQAYRWQEWGRLAGTSGYDANGALYWTAPDQVWFSSIVYSPGATNSLDGMTMGSALGKWTVAYDDPHVNQPAGSAGGSMAAVWLWAGKDSYGNTYNSATTTPVNLSGPHAGTTTGVAIPPGNIGLSSGSITSISLAGIDPSLLSGYQGAIVVITPTANPLFSAVAVATVSGGSITRVDVINPGANYGTTPTVTLYGTAVSGTQVTQVWDVEPVASPTTWEVRLTLNVAAAAGNDGSGDGNGHFTPSNIWVVAPDPTTLAAAASIDRADTLAVDDAVIGALSGPGGRNVGVLRFMDANLGYIGSSNWVYATDLVDPDGPVGSWQSAWSTTTFFRYARYYNTDPNSTTYAWSSPRVYGPQAYFSQVDPPSSITGTTTAGSATVSAVSDPALMCGSAVSGPGIPAGATIVRLASDGSSFTLSSAATASGSGVALSVTSPPYITAAPGDDGYYLNYGSGAGTCLVMEFRSETPHGLTTGQMVAITGSSPIPVGDGSGLVNPYSPALSNCFVTGPYTIAFQLYAGFNLYAGAPTLDRGRVVGSTTEVDLSRTAVSVAASVGYGSPTASLTAGTTDGLYVGDLVTGPGIQADTYVSQVNSSTTFSLTRPAIATTSGTYTVRTTGWKVVLEMPSSDGTALLPYEFSANLVKQLPGTAYWLNIPPFASDALVAEIARRVAAHIGTTNPVYLEYSNETWNGGTYAHLYMHSLACLLGYLPAGSTALGGSYTSTGQAIPSGVTGVEGAGPLVASHLYDIFAAEWQAQGLDPARVRRVYGTFWTGPSTMEVAMETCHRYGLHFDHFAVGPYLDCPGSTSARAAMSPAGSAVDAGSWPADAINDLFRHWMAYSGSLQSSNWGTATAICAAYGQPVRSVTLGTANASIRANLTPTSVASVSGSGGSGYDPDDPPTVYIVGGGGSGATATANVAAGYVAGIKGLAGGSGYTSAPAVTFSGGGGSGAAGTATISGGAVVGVAITAGGSGYTSGPAIAFSGGGGSGASATGVVSSAIASLTLTSGGSGYTSPPAVEVSFPGFGVSLAVTLAPTSVASFTLTDPGRGYLADPAISISGGGGSGASFSIQGRDAAGSIAGLAFNSGGSGYTSSPSVFLSGGGGQLGAGGFHACYTFVDGQGRETTVGRGRSNGWALNAGDVATMEMPAWPAWAQAMNVYMTSGAAGSEVFYLQVPRSQYGTTYPVGSWIPLNQPIPSPGTPPPSTNLAAANVPSLPTMACYEGGCEGPVPGGVPFQPQLLHDSFYHPSARDMIWGWYAAAQWNGATVANYYQIWNPLGYATGSNGIWSLGVGTQQLPGDGLGSTYAGADTYAAAGPNRFATIQGGYPADGHDHGGGPQANASPALQGLRDWFGAFAPPPSPSPPSPRRRRWFSGLGQSALRLGR